MRGMRMLAAVFTLGLVLLAGGIGEVASSLTDSETSLDNTLRAWTSTPWVQTTQADFEAGVLIQADTRSRSGDVGLATLNRIFALQGGSANFWAYGVPANLWTPMTSAPNAVGAGGALAYDGSRYIYALRGNNTATLWRYDTILDSWAAMANAPAAVAVGGALAYDGSRYVYAFRGNNQTAFWRYDTTLNTWVVMAVAPARVGAGGALACDGLGYLYGFRGNGTTAFWSYDVPSDIWTVMANAPGNVANGGALAFVGANTYVNMGTAASPVRDTGIVGARWDGLFWDETLPLNTDVTFEVRASDTVFAADNATLPWTPVGGTSPVTSGLPSGRYLQWRATLTTTDTTVTPVLHEVRVYHY
jgi:hypothetical protein